MSDPFPFPAELCCASALARRPAVIISACLEGQPVRYDATAKRLTDLPALAAALTLLPHCPEVAAGLGLPRPPVQLVATDATGMRDIRVLGRDDPRLDATAALVAHAETEAKTLLTHRPSVSGYLWKSRSPSCGLGSTPVWQAETGSAGDATAVTSAAPLSQIAVRDGIHAAAIRRTLPWLAMTEESALTSPLAQARFVLACRLVAAALDPATSLTDLWSAQTTLWSASGVIGSRLQQHAQADDRRGYARISGAAVLEGGVNSVERLLVQCARELGA